MARDIDLTKPLSKADVAWLTARYPQSRVDHMVALAGQAQEVPEKGDETGDGDSAPEAPEVPETGGEGAETGEEDLIGDGEPYDPGAHTADEVVKYLKDASDEEKSRVLAAEADGKGRSTILNA